MSTSFFGHAVPVGLRKFPETPVTFLDGTIRVIPNAMLSDKTRLAPVIICFKNSQAWDVKPWRETLTHFHDKIAPPTMVFLSPTWKRAFHSVWAWRCSQWVSAQSADSGAVGAAYVDQVVWKAQLGLLNEDLTTFLLAPDGSIALCSQGLFSPQKSVVAIRAALAKFSCN
jgi:hypothetical protein